MSFSITAQIILYFVFILWELHTCKIHCNPSPRTLPWSPPPHLSLSQLHVLSLKSLHPVAAVSIHTGIQPSPGAWATYPGWYPLRPWSSFPQQLPTANSYSVRGRASRAIHVAVLTGLVLHRSSVCSHSGCQSVCAEGLSCPESTLAQQSSETSGSYNHFFSLSFNHLWALRGCRCPVLGWALWSPILYGFTHCESLGNITVLLWVPYWSF